MVKMGIKHKAICVECDEDLTDWEDRKEPVLNEARSHEHDDINIVGKTYDKGEQQGLGDY